MTRGIPFDPSRIAQLTLSPVQVAANTTAEQTFTVNGLKTGDIILALNKPTNQAGLGIVNYRVSAANTLAVAFSNNTASPITPTASEKYLVAVMRPDSLETDGSIQFR
jgi:hypothetical protein